MAAICIHIYTYLHNLISKSIKVWRSPFEVFKLQFEASNYSFVLSIFSLHFILRCQIEVKDGRNKTVNSFKVQVMSIDIYVKLSIMFILCQHRIEDFSR